MKALKRPGWDRTRLLLALSVIGPGIITANVDNDAGGITTYSVAGAHYGYALLWIVPVVAVVLIIIQEMSARLGVITGKGLGDLIRETMGVRATALILAFLVFVNLANTVSEFAGVAASMEIFGVSKFLSVPLAAIGVWLLIIKGNYQTTERIFLVASAIYLAYVASGILAKPDWHTAGHALVRPSFHFEAGYITIFVTYIGTTIAPWMQFYQQAATADKGIKPKDYHLAVIDVIFGAFISQVVTFFVIIACAGTLYRHGIRIVDAKDAAMALKPLAGQYASTLFALGLLNASLFSASILPLSTAYTVCEAFGWESSVSRRFREAPTFFGIYTALIALGALIILLPIRSLVKAMLVSQTMNGVLLPVILIAMLRLINDKRLMGRFTNGRVYNILSWVTAVILIVLALILISTTFFAG
jgi:Mn2+/Fe2+ NRAMP family transporter